MQRRTYHEVIPVERPANFVMPLSGEIVDNHELTVADGHAIAGGQQLANLAMSGRTALSRAAQSDTAITHSTAFLIASAPVVGALTMLTTGFCLLGWLVAGGPAVVWIGVELLVLGGAAFVALNRQRRAGLDHTPAGVERHEITVRGQVAMHAIDRHAEMLERIKGVRK